MITEGATLWARKTIASEIFAKPDKWFKIWFYLVNKANHKDNGRFRRGQCFMKYEWIKDATGATKDQVKHCVEWLKVSQMLATQKATRGFYITIVNYDTYQNMDNYRSHTESHIKATQKPHRSHTKNNNVLMKQCINDKHYTQNSIEFELSALLFSLIQQRKPDIKKPDLQTWAVHIERMIRIDKREPDRIRAVIEWSQADTGDGGKWLGWQNNILSTAKLREKFDILELKKNAQHSGKVKRSFRDQKSAYGETV